MRGTSEHKQNGRDNVCSAHVKGLPSRVLTELGGGGETLGDCGRRREVGSQGFVSKREFGFYSECERKSAEDAKCITLLVLVIVRFLSNYM